MEIKRRSTQIQQFIRDLLHNSPDALCHADIEAKINIPADRATIFRVLARLVEDGFAHKIISDDGKWYYASCHSGCDKTQHHDEHAHFRCVQCNTISCLNDNLTPSLPPNYKVLHTNIVITGVCPVCC